MSEQDTNNEIDTNNEVVPFEERIICRGRTGSQRSLAQAKLGKNL